MRHVGRATVVAVQKQQQQFGLVPILDGFIRSLVCYSLAATLVWLRVDFFNDDYMIMMITLALNDEIGNWEERMNRTRMKKLADGYSGKTEEVSKGQNKTDISIKLEIDTKTTILERGSVYFVLLPEIYTYSEITFEKSQHFDLKNMLNCCYILEIGEYHWKPL